MLWSACCRDGCRDAVPEDHALHLSLLLASRCRRTKEEHAEAVDDFVAAVGDFMAGMLLLADVPADRAMDGIRKSIAVPFRGAAEAATVVVVARAAAREIPRAAAAWALAHVTRRGDAVLILVLMHPPPATSITVTTSSSRASLLFRSVGLRNANAFVCRPIEIHHRALFVDSPVGARFSFSRNPKGYDVGDVSSSLELKKFLTKWFAEHPDYLANPFYVGGDSRGGKLVPFLSQKISEDTEAGLSPAINLKVKNPGDSHSSRGAARPATGQRRSRGHIRTVIV